MVRNRQCDDKRDCFGNGMCQADESCLCLHDNVDGKFCEKENDMGVHRLRNELYGIKEQSEQQSTHTKQDDQEEDEDDEDGSVVDLDSQKNSEEKVSAKLSQKLENKINKGNKKSKNKKFTDNKKDLLNIQ